jgi:hypothetical protein
MFRTSYVHHKEDRLYMHFYVMFFMHFCKQISRWKDVCFVGLGYIIESQSTVQKHEIKNGFTPPFPLYAFMTWSSICILQYIRVGRDSSVGIATRYGLEGPGIECRLGARFSPPVQTGPGSQSASFTMGTASFPGVKRPGRGVDHPPHLAPRLKKE